AAMSAGVCDAALHITAEYTKTREQFGRKIATFQAVSQRVGDIYIDTEAIRLTALQAAWRIGQGLPAAREVAIAKYWAAEGGWRVVFAAQHLHGGMGLDRGDVERPRFRLRLRKPRLRSLRRPRRQHLSPLDCSTPASPL